MQCTEREFYMRARARAREEAYGRMEFESGRANSPWTTLGIVRVSKRAHETVPVEGGGKEGG